MITPSSQPPSSQPFIPLVVHRRAGEDQRRVEHVAAIGVGEPEVDARDRSRSMTDSSADRLPELLSSATLASLRESV